ncbi:MAG: enoyl-CoA hydratase-related protein [Candidatus Eremiobacterota bacterium]
MQTLTLAREGPVAQVEMNRPETHNAFNQVLIDEMLEVIERLGSDPAVRVIVLAGRGKNFSAGADVEWMKSQAVATAQENMASGQRMARVFEAIDRCPKPVVARVQGAALGGGSGLVCAVDIAVAHRDAKFGFTEVRLGIIPAVISPFVIRRIGPSAARARFLTGERFGAEEALRIGMVHAVAEDLDVAMERVLRGLLSSAPGAQARTKELVRRVQELPLDQQTAYTAEATALARAAEEGREGLSAFLEKRSPAWATEWASGLETRAHRE